MTRRFIAHEARPLRDAGPKQPVPAAAAPGNFDKAEKTTEPGKAGKSGAVGKAAVGKAAVGKAAVGKAKETGGPSGPEPTRYGDWERKGICVDF